MADEQPETLSKLGRFIHSYSSFLSSFVIGVAGLVATSIWQYRQSQNTAKQAESEQAIARTKADNEWRIARAEILAKNLNVLSLQGPQSADQRFGVLLSLTRGNILDSELAVSYALELGKDNPYYMKSVLSNTSGKNYLQLKEAFALTCMQRFGVEKNAEICRDDKLSDRSDAIAELISDELNDTSSSAAFAQGAMTLLKDERAVHVHPTKMSWLFETYLQDLYERRQWNEIKRFEDFSTGARLVAGLVLATARTGELVSSGEQVVLDKFHADHRKQLVAYMFGGKCDPECRANIANTMLSIYGEAQGDYDETFQRLLLASRAESGPVLARLHVRLLWCQVDTEDLIAFRDKVLAPVVTKAAADLKIDPVLLEDLAGLAALAPEPKPSDAGASAWKTMIEALAKRDDKFIKMYQAKRRNAQHERLKPPAMVRKMNFCTAAQMVEETPPSDQ